MRAFGLLPPRPAGHLASHRPARPAVAGRPYRTDPSRPARSDHEDARRNLGDRRGAAASPGMDVPDRREHPRAEPRVPRRPPARCGDPGAASVAAHVAEDYVFARGDDPPKLNDLLCGHAGLSEARAAAAGAPGGNSPRRACSPRSCMSGPGGLRSCPAASPPDAGRAAPNGPTPAVLGATRAAPRREVVAVVAPAACGQPLVVVPRGLVGLEPPDPSVALGDLGGVIWQSS